jgi:hypothetical protein
VAAALAAHVTARVPLSSSLIPSVLHLLGDEVRWGLQLPACAVCTRCGCDEGTALGSSAAAARTAGD